MELIALISSGKGTWGQVAGVINNHDWDKIILIGSDFAKKFNIQKDFEFIEIRSHRIIEMRDEILGVNLFTQSYFNDIIGTEGHNGFAGVYGDSRIEHRAGKGWDILLKEYLYLHLLH